jgi:hypothetical protein
MRLVFIRVGRHNEGQRTCVFFGKVSLRRFSVRPGMPLVIRESSRMTGIQPFTPWQERTVNL